MRKILVYTSVVMLISLSFNSYKQMNKKVVFQQDNQQRLQPKDSLIFWSRDRKLVVSDFKGKPNYNEIFAARTYFTITLNPKSFEDSIIVIIENHFEVYNSWMKVEDSTKLILEHEQGHFDIAEICARKMRQAISIAIIKDRKSASVFFKEINNYQWSLYLKLNNQYEKETNTGSNKAKQKEWSEKIAKMLKELEAYSSTKVVVKLNK